MHCLVDLRDPMCIWAFSPLKTSRWAPLVRDGNTSPHNFRQFSWEAAAVKVPPQTSGAD